MLIKECKMPDISNLEPTAVGCFLAASLAGAIKDRTREIKVCLPVMARLIDKARTEYLIAREAVIEEEKEGKLTYDQIISRGNGQYLYTCTIINHLENCINAISRIYKLLKILPNEHSFRPDKNITKLRNAIEHMEDRISNAASGSMSLNISEDALSAEITDVTIKLEDIANQIKYLYDTIRNIIQTDKPKTHLTS